MYDFERTFGHLAGPAARSSPRYPVIGCPVLMVPGGKVVVGVVIVIALAVSGTGAVAHGVSIWVLAAVAVGGARRGHLGGRLVFHLLSPEPVPASATAVTDVRSDDDRVD